MASASGGVIDQRARDATHQAARLTNAFCRGTAEFQSAGLTLQKLRRGGQQVLTVHHVTVKQGGPLFKNALFRQTPLLASFCRETPVFVCMRARFSRMKRQPYHHKLCFMVV